VYISSGEFGVIARFLNSRDEILQQITLVSGIKVGSYEETLSYVTSLAFVSLDLVIVALDLIVVALMLVELRIKDTRTHERKDGQEKYAETEP
jgi:hypothetical protein